MKSWLATVGSGGHRRTRIVTVSLCIKLKTRRQEEEGRLWLSVSIRFFTPVSLTMHRLIFDEIGAKQEASCFCSYHLIAFVCLLYQDGGVTKKKTAGIAKHGLDFLCETSGLKEKRHDQNKLVLVCCVTTFNKLNSLLQGESVTRIFLSFKAKTDTPSLPPPPPPPPLKINKCKDLSANKG